MKYLLAPILLFFFWLSLPIFKVLSEDLPYDNAFEFICVLAFGPVLIFYLIWLLDSDKNPS